MNMNIEIEQDLYESLIKKAEVEKTSAEFIVVGFIKSGIEKREEKSLNDKIWDAIQKKNYPYKKFEVNEKGHIVIDKEKDPELYDWAVNG